MKCPNVEERLSEYLERSLPAQDIAAIAEHLHECDGCSGLLDEMRSVVATCKAFPRLEPDAALIERILLRTSGKPRTRTWGEMLRQYVVGPLFTPRFAVGATLAVLFLALAVNLMLPRMSVVASILSPRELASQMDKGVQRIYSQGLKAYDKKNEWQAQFTFFKNNVFNKLGFMIEQLDVPVEGNKKKSGEPRQQQEKNPGDKSSLLLLPT
jgi:hypothetical protein